MNIRLTNQLQMAGVANADSANLKSSENIGSLSAEKKHGENGVNHQRGERRGGGQIANTKEPAKVD